MILGSSGFDNFSGQKFTVICSRYNVSALQYSFANHSGCLLQEDALRLWGLAERDAAFEKYAHSCVAEWRALGRDTGPMELFLARPRVDLKASI